MKAFIGHSFADGDMEVINKILKFIGTTDIEYQTGEKAQNKSIASKVKERILNNDIFIGIFTFDKKIECLTGDKEYYTTSNWVIQESGFAIGNKKGLILLVEKEEKKTIYKFPELQGDLELVYFNRNSLDEAFIKLNEIIHSLKEEQLESISGDIELKEDIAEETGTINNIKEGKDEAFEKLFNAIKNEKDYEKVQEIYTDELEPILSNDEKPIINAFVLRCCHEIGDSTAFKKLIRHVNINKDNPAVISHLANRYYDMGEYKKSKEQFLIMKDLYDINDEKEKELIIECYNKAASCLIFDGKCKEAIDLISEILYKDIFEENKAKILSMLARVSKRCNDLDKFFIYGEMALDIDPSDTDLRFNLAYQYSHKNHQKLSLLHYKKLTNAIESPMGLNNLGVQYGALDIPGKSIKSYFKAKEHNVTLAMANIAQKYLDKGFIQDAKNEIDNANELSNEGVDVHGNIGNAKNRLKQILENEDNKEREILVEAENEREFRVKYSEAFLDNNHVIKDKLEGNWETPWGNLNLRYNEDENTFKVNQKMIKSKDSEEWIISNSNSEELTKYRFIKIEGTVEKLVGTYKIKIEHITEYNSNVVSPTINKVHEATGYMIINKNCASINVMEKNENETIYKNWEKI